MKVAESGQRYSFWGTAVLLLLGLGFTLWLLLHEGWQAIGRILWEGGWALLLLIPLHVLVIHLDARGWRWLLRDQPVGTPFLTWLALLRESINGLLPVARIGGELVGAQLLARAGIPASVAGASVLVEVSLTLLSQFFFTLIGFALLLLVVGDVELQRQVLIFLLVTFPVMMAFYWVQRRWGIFRLLEGGLRMLLGRSDLLLALGDTRVLDAAVCRLYDRRWSLLWANVWQLAGLFAGVAELYLTFALLHRPIHWVDAILLESLGQALRSVAFFVPGGIGVQEGGFLLFGAAVGIGPDVALAYSLARRLRELALGIPILLFWYGAEGHHLRRQRHARLTSEGLS